MPPKHSEPEPQNEEVIDEVKVEVKDEVKEVKEETPKWEWVNKKFKPNDR